jgi:hypothetical protein
MAKLEAKIPELQADEICAFADGWRKRPWSDYTDSFRA